MNETPVNGDIAIKRKIIGEWRWAHKGRDISLFRQEVKFELSMSDYEALRQIAADWETPLQTVLETTIQKLIREWREV